MNSFTDLLAGFTVKLSEYPQLRTMLKHIGYRRHTARIVPSSRCELNGRYWAGGSRDSYTVCNIMQMHFHPIPQCAPPQFGGPTEPQFHDILPGQCVISHGTFCGKPAHAAVYIGADGLILLGLPDPRVFHE